MICLVVAMGLLRVLIGGGGTGGHLFPGIALAEELRRRHSDAKILFVGSPFGIETRVVPKAGFELALLPVSGLRRKGPLGWLLGLLRLPVALLRALLVVRRFKPQAAVSVGGYSAGPAVLAARLCGVPCFVIEQNAVPGVTNRLLAHLARAVFVALPARGFPASRVQVVGNPVRESLLAVRDVPYQPRSPLRILVLGGSQGARAINDAMLAAAPRLAAGTRIVHQAGVSDVERIRAGYARAGVRQVTVQAFIDDMAAAYRDADLVVSRAGATTIAELTVCGRPAVFIPFPFAAGDHQTANAVALAAAGAALHVPQHELTGERLAELIGTLAADGERLGSMAAAARQLGKPHAVRDIADAIEAEVTPEKEAPHVSR